MSTERASIEFLSRTGPVALAAAPFVALAALLLVAAGQPLATDDTWLHLALGQAYAAGGPWLDADPLLATSLGAPNPAAWLFDVGIFGIERGAGFLGLRVAHILGVGAILALAWWLLRRASGSRIFASLACSVFIVLSAYRLIQLRPHLLTILAALALYWLLVETPTRPSWKRITAGAGLLCLWANLHAAFLIGPLLLGAAFAGVALFAMGSGGSPQAGHRDRAVGLAIAAGVGGLATFLNPGGFRPHLAWWVAGSETPELSRVGDEWTPVDLFSFPLPGLPPTPLAWVVFWGLIIACVGVGFYALRAWRQGEREGAESPPIDPALAAISVLALALPLVAVRFLWLGIFPLLLIGQAIRARSKLGESGRATPWLAACAGLLLWPAFLQFGDGPMIQSTVPDSWRGYRETYRAGKYHANLVWMLDDAELRGVAFADYHIAGFMGFWLAPDLRTLINGTLNVSQETIAANLPLRERRGERENETFLELLDRHGVDLFVGIRMPRGANSARPWFHSTAHLERSLGWIRIFRNLTGAIYLRDVPRNRENLERVTAYYLDQEISFDPGTGFEPERVIRENRGWSIRHGLIPAHFDQIAEAAYGNESRSKALARDRMAGLYAVLGLYERAIELDTKLLETDPDFARARRRLAWSLLRLGRFAEAAEAAGPLAESSPEGSLSHRIAETARHALSEEDPEKRAQRVALLPLLNYAEAQLLTIGVVAPPARDRPR